jgi:hypothetical protein
MPSLWILAHCPGLSGLARQCDRDLRGQTDIRVAATQPRLLCSTETGASTSLRRILLAESIELNLEPHAFTRNDTVRFIRSNYELISSRQSLWLISMLSKHEVHLSCQYDHEAIDSSCRAVIGQQRSRHVVTVKLRRSASAGRTGWKLSIDHA